MRKRRFGQPVTKFDYRSLSVVQLRSDTFYQLLDTHFSVNGIENFILFGYHVYQRQFVSVLVGLDVFVQRYFICRTFLFSEMHTDFIFDALCGISHEPDLLLGLVTVNAFYQTYRAYRNKVVLVFRRRIVFFNDVRNKSHVVFDEFRTCAVVSFQHFFNEFLFFFFGKRRWKRPCLTDMQYKQKQI